MLDLEQQNTIELIPALVQNPISILDLFCYVGFTASFIFLVLFLIEVSSSNSGEEK